MTIGYSIATALETLDTLNEESTCAQIRTSASLLETILDRLDEWHAWFTSHSPDAASLLSTQQCSNGQTTLPFLDTAAANDLTHYWTFSVMCFTYLDQLLNRWPSITNRQTDAKGGGSLSNVTAQQYATWTLQSTTYLTQDDQKLFGATSLAFPFKVGFGFLPRRGGVHGRYVCDTAIRRLGLKGYQYLVKFTHSTLPNLGPLVMAHHRHE
jgi:hypothetical protein